MPYKVTARVYSSDGGERDVPGPTFDTRAEAYAELEKIKRAQEVFNTGDANENPEPFDQALKELPGWLYVSSVGNIITANVEGSGP